MREENVILIIEDDEPIRDSLKEILEQEGYKVFTACNGSDGLAILKEVPHPCLILLDLFMPVMSGPEFLKAIQTEEAQAVTDLPIVVLSASPPEGATALAVKPITRGFIKKPLDLDEFLMTVERFCPISPIHARKK